MMLLKMFDAVTPCMNGRLQSYCMCPRAAVVSNVYDFIYVRGVVLTIEEGISKRGNPFLWARKGRHIEMYILR